ncbi:BLOC-1-related complex subunit 8-like isoform X2 [Varroa jacobsoni]|uniref:BLOC-1-related complex subunit 8-like isoform X1 n=1 Tax=Varroa jacobsoni TaxID=62625 RepID=UPI000BF6EF58|nr:BLOC-1-related complex subunit 8-like isoform X1 [Varroa jacobsoni]XP_022699321.1 BLOC-1-related complex subunit 8-like isoform X2 [Varroa jacobsoni]
MIAEQTLTRNAAGNVVGLGRPADVELDHRVRSVSNKFADNVHIIANEPTLACYRLQEHVRKSLPGLVEKQYALVRNDRALEGRVFDLDYDIKAVKDIYPAEARFRTVQEMLKNSIFMKQELDQSRIARSYTTNEDKQSKKMKRSSRSFDRQGTEGVRLSTASGEQRSTPLLIENSIGERGRGSLKENSKERSGSIQSTGSYKSFLYHRINAPTK